MGKVSGRSGSRGKGNKLGKLGIMVGIEGFSSGVMSDETVRLVGSYEFLVA